MSRTRRIHYPGVRWRGAQGDFALIDLLTDVSAVQIGGHHYALVTSSHVGTGSDPGALVIVNITNPDSISHVWSGRAGTDTLPGRSVNEIHSVQIGGHPYAVAHINNNVAILNITNPGNITRSSDVFHGSVNLAVTEIDSRHYVLAGRDPGDGFTIVDITDPSAPYSVANVTEGYGSGRTFDILRSITAVEIDGIHYAVTVDSDYIVVTDITDPADPLAAGTLNIKTSKDSLGSLYIRDDVVKISGRHYVPAIGGDGMFFTMLDITDPSGITAGRGGDLPKFDEILEIHDVVTIEINGIPYALTASEEDNSVQIIDMSDPSSPIPVAGVTNGHGGSDTLSHPWYIDAAEIGGRYYALVTARGIDFRTLDENLHIIDITDPASPFPIASVTNARDGFGGCYFSTTSP